MMRINKSLSGVTKIIQYFIYPMIEINAPFVNGIWVTGLEIRNLRQSAWFCRNQAADKIAASLSVDREIMYKRLQSLRQLGELWQVHLAGPDLQWLAGIGEVEIKTQAALLR